MSSTDPTARRRGRALTVVAAAIAALAVWVIARLAGVDLAAQLGDQTQEVTAAGVIIFSVVAGLAGWALLALLERFTSRARTVWIMVALIVLVLSLAGPLGGVTTATQVSLAFMHLATAAVLIPGLARTSPGGRP